MIPTGRRLEGLKGGWWELKTTCITRIVSRLQERRLVWVYINEATRHTRQEISIPAHI